VNFSLPGEELRNWREEHRLTQDEFGSLLGISREWIGKLENNKRPVSAEIFLRFQGLNRDPKFSHQPREGEESAPSSVKFDASGPLVAEIRSLFQELLNLTCGDAKRLGWLYEELESLRLKKKQWANHLQDLLVDLDHVENEHRAHLRRSGAEIAAEKPDQEVV
jgi:transcriptional regulator with XRE-family HTH domain